LRAIVFQVNVVGVPCETLGKVQQGGLATS